MIYTTWHRKLKIELHELHKKPGVISGAQKGKQFSAPQVVPVV